MSFAFISPVVELSGSDSIELCPNHILTRATPQQVLEIKEILGEGKAFWCFFQIFETAPIPGKPRSRRFLPPEEWRYHVVNFAGVNEHTGNLQDALNVVVGNVDLLVTSLDTVPGNAFVWDPGALSQQMNAHPSAPGVSFRSEWKEAVWKAFNHFLGLKSNDYPMAAIRQFSNLRGLPRSSGAYILGLFSILEMVLTHQPDTDHDSLSHQVSSKMVLLGNRFPLPLDYSPFPETEAVKIWKSLYDYRSRIAHGGQIDFASKSLRPLKDENTARTFLFSAVQALLRHTLEEPRLINDLKSC